MNSDELRKLAETAGFSDLGVGSASQNVHLDFYRSWLQRGYAGEMDYLSRHLSLKEDVRNLLPECRSIIAVALDYNQPVEHQVGLPKVARYALGRDYHKVLAQKGKRLIRLIQESQPEAKFRFCVDSAPVLEREHAQGAGLGWFGKNTCLINSRRGSWFFIGILLTSLEITPDPPAVGGCGTCRTCIDACPTGAIVFEENRWQIDSRACISYLTIEQRSPIEFDAEIHGWTFGCDVCQEVCPFNQVRGSQPERGGLTLEADFLTRKELPKLKELADISHKDWDELTRGSAMRRVGWEKLKETAKINLRQAKVSEFRPPTDPSKKEF